MNYGDRVVLVTSGNSGLGRAFVERFVFEGAQVVSCGRNHRTLSALRTALPNVDTVRCDITSSAEIDMLVEHIDQSYGRLDLLVKNSGVMERVNMLASEVDDAAIAREIATNLIAPILLTRRLLPLLLRSEQALILMVTSGYALLPARQAPTYSATKAGLRSFTKALRYQVKDAGIRVVETLPPLVDTPCTADVHKPKMSPSAVVEETLRGLARGADEIFVGRVRWLPLLMRMAPGYAARVVASS